MNGGSGHDNGNGNPHGTINSNAENIPLKCYLCPGTQTFSDVSHLLTHISSKSHLAVRFRIGLSDSDEDKQRILDFDNWAAQYGINRLLKSRQDAKDQKKQGQQQKRQRATGSQVAMPTLRFFPYSLLTTFRGRLATLPRLLPESLPPRLSMTASRPKPTMIFTPKWTTTYWP